MTKVGRGARVGAFTTARDLAERGADWLEEHMVDLLETPAGQARLYRLPYALARAGRLQAATLAMDLVSQRLLTPEGDLAPGPMRERFSARWASYPMTILASGARAVGESDVARAILAKVIQDLADPQTGGMLGERPEVRRTRRQDLFTTAQFGLTALDLGQVDAAGKARGWILDWWRRQPDLDAAVYLSMDGNEHIVVDEPDRQGEAGSVLDFGAPGQPLASLGIAAALLADRRYDDESALAVAAEIQAQYARTPVWASDHRISVQLCKRIWGAARLLEATGEPAYEAEVIDMVEWFRRGSSPDGNWIAPAHLVGDTGTDRIAIDAEITAEFVQHVTTAAEALSPGGDDVEG